MRSPAARLTLGVAAWIACGAAAFFILQSEQNLTPRRGRLRAFDVVAREASASLSSLRPAQQAYVAPGQGSGFWMSQVDILLESAKARVKELQQVATAPDARQSLDDAASSVTDLSAIDRRARQYLHTDQPLMAADVVFAEGGETAATASRQVEAARQAEFVTFDNAEAAARRQQVSAAGGAFGLTALIVGILVLLPRPTAATEVDRSAPATAAPPKAEPAPVDEPIGQALHLSEPDPPSSVSLPVSPEPPRESVPVLKAAADLCTELNRVRELDDLTRLLARAAQVMEASGLVVWIGAATGASLRPVLAHGYSPEALARMPHVPRSDDNAAAAAYRTGELQIVLNRPGLSSGAIAAPMFSPDGCIGALTAEILNGSETSEGIQAIAAIVASQLASVLADAVLQAEADDTRESRIASA